MSSKGIVAIFVLVLINKALKYNRSSKKVEGIVTYQVRFGLKLIDDMQEFELAAVECN